MSNLRGRPRKHPIVRHGSDVSLGTRQAAAALTNWHPDMVRRRCEPVACDVLSRVPLYDLEAVTAVARSTSRRVA